MELAKQIKQGREKQGWSQAQLADKLHISRQSVSKWENNQTYPDIEKLLEMSDLFGVTVDSMLRSDNEYQDIIVEQTVSNPEHSWVNPKELPTVAEEYHLARYATVQITLMILILVVLTILVLVIAF